MTDSSALQVDNCTSDDFDRTLRTVLKSVTATHRKLLYHHFLASKQAASTKELSEAMGWKGDSASMHYGGFAALLEPFISRPDGSDKLYLIGRYDQSQNRWVLRQEFIEASQRVGLL